MIRTLITLTAVLVLTATAHADELSEQEDQSYWELALAGGMLVPFDQMANEHQQSLAGNVRVGWVSSLGLGIDLAVDYSPLSRQAQNPDDIYDIHFATAGVMPRVTLGKKLVRLWLAAGGGMTFEHAKHVATVPGTELEPALSRFSPAGMGAAGLELHAFPGVGLAVTGSYTRNFGDSEYQMLNVTGGLAVTFH